MIELAPRHKTGLALRSPIMGASGCWGFADEYAAWVDFARMGAVVSNAITWHARLPAGAAGAWTVPGGAVLHTGLPNPGLKGALKTFASRWKRMPCPMIVHLACEDPDQTARMVERLENVENVFGVEVGLPPASSAETIRENLLAARSDMLPVLVQAPSEQVWEYAEIASQVRVQGLVVAGAPRASIVDPQSATAGTIRNGRLYSAALFPSLLHTLRELANQTPLSLIACGGIHSIEQVRTALAAGAKAVQIDSAVWRNGVAHLLTEDWQSAEQA
jgi:dihydroorotate dehydrogenase (NAD+) catalytic subunit